MSEMFVVGGGALLGLLFFAVQIALLLYVLSLLRRMAEGVEHIGAALDRLAPRSATSRLAPDTPVAWVGRPREVEGMSVVPGVEGRVVDDADELVVAFGHATFTCAHDEVRPLT